MQKLTEGVHRFKDNIFETKRSLFERLSGGQHPMALFITCSDSRVDPCLITQTEPGDLFILRNAGNIVPPYGACPSGEAGTIEYAVRALQIEDIIVCGHSQCGAMGGLLYPDTVRDLPAVKSWLSHAEATQRIMLENYNHIQDQDDRLATAVQENVLVQLDNLRTHPSVSAALAREKLRLHGWVYSFQTGDVSAYDPASRSFQSLTAQEIAKNSTPSKT